MIDDWSTQTVSNQNAAMRYTSNAKSPQFIYLVEVLKLNQSHLLSRTVFRDILHFVSVKGDLIKITILRKLMY